MWRSSSRRNITVFSEPRRPFLPSSARCLASAARPASVIASASAGHAPSVTLGWFAFYDVPGTPHLVQLAVLTTTCRDGEHQKCSAVPFDAFQHCEQWRGKLQITHAEYPEGALVFPKNIHSC